MYHRARPQDGDYKFWGISLLNIEGGSGSSNELYDEGTLFYTSGHQFIGIQMEMCRNFFWGSNIIKGDGIAGFNNEFAFNTAESPSCYYSCNYMDQLGVGMKFAQDCSASRLTENNFNTHSTAGLSLSQNGTMIGQQLYRSNTWNGSSNGSSSQKDAYLEFDGYMPFNTIHANQVKKSLFKIQNNNQNSPLWADPRVVETGGNDPNWFAAGTGTITVSECYTTTPPDKDMDEVEKELTTGVYSPYNGFAASTWDAEFLLFDKLRSTPTLMLSGSVENNWYNTRQNTSVGKMARIYRGMVDLTGPTATSSATQLLNDLSLVDVSAVHEKNMKTVLGISLTAMTANASQLSEVPLSEVPLSEVQLSEVQLKQLGLIAKQCRYQGGWGVALARAMLKRPLVSTDDCPPGLTDGGTEDRNTIPAALPTVEVFPNPVQHLLYVNISTTLTDGQISLINLTGQTVREVNANGYQTLVPVSDLQNGIYILEVKDNSGYSFRSKISIFN